jgi:uncharacterized protein (TIGR02145 family)
MTFVVNGAKISDVIMNRDVISGLMKFVVLISLVLAVITCKKDEKETTSLAPVALTNSASWPGRNWVVLKGQVNGKNQLTTVVFQYDTTNTYTHTISPVPDTTTKNYNVSFTATLTGLKPNTQYHFRINAVNVSGTGNGADVSFKTTDTSNIVINFNPDLIYDSIYDSEGNKYRTIQIGSQTWMAENLRSTRFDDGTAIPFVPDVTAWTSLTTPGYCWYNSDSIGYGALYNWYTANTGKLCPAGWHVPSDEEWTILTDYLGGKSVAGAKLKEEGTSHWLSPNTGATNETGFTALPSGYRSYAGGFNSIKAYGFWWSSTEWASTSAWYRDVYYGYIAADRSNSNKKSGANIRCVKD